MQHNRFKLEITSAVLLASVGTSLLNCRSAASLHDGQYHFGLDLASEKFEW